MIQKVVYHELFVFKNECITQTWSKSVSRSDESLEILFILYTLMIRKTLLHYFWNLVELKEKWSYITNNSRAKKIAIW